MSIKIYLYIFLSILSFIFFAFAIYFNFVQVPESCNLCPKYMNGPQCISVIEKFQDPTIPKPTPLIYQTNFTLAPGGGPPFCSPVWYAFRYVKNKNGGYGPLSAWSGITDTKSTSPPNAIYAGNKNPPCISSICNFKTGEDSCAFNRPEISLSGKLDLNVLTNNPDDGYTLNVHRQVGTGFDKNGNPLGYDPTSEGTIVGSFLVTPNDQSFTDIFFNPNTTTGSSCC